MFLVFTMAGKYERFQSFGHKVPKYLLPLANGTVLSEVGKSLALKNSITEVLLIANTADQLFVPVIKSIANSVFDMESKLSFIEDTSGQLETAYMAKQLAPHMICNKPICFANIDTVLHHRETYFERLYSARSENLAALIDTFNAKSKFYSYCVADEKNKVREVADNRVISEEACSGLYGFPSAKIFFEAAENVLTNNRNANFTSLLNFMLNQGMNIEKKLNARSSNTIVLGTPEEYIRNIHRF